jgi:hypothetical protein
MNELTTRLFQAFLAPAILVSATGLLILSINVRLMGIVSRLRQYVHAKHDAAKNGRVQEAEAYDTQIKAIEHRAEVLRRCFLMVLVSLIPTFIPGGLGYVDGLMNLLYGLAGVKQSDAFSGTFVIRLVTLWFLTAVGGLCTLYLARATGKERSGR